MRKYLVITFFMMSLVAFSQQKETRSPETYGFRHLKVPYQNDIVNVLIRSKKGEESKEKPILLFIHGSLAVPLILIYNETVPYGTFPFRPELLTDKFHLAVISKPYIPLIVDDTKLKPDRSYYAPETKKLPPQYVARNYLGYYVNRNLEVIKYLKNLSWVSDNKFIVAGHSAGATVAAKLGSVSTDVTHVIYSGGNPLGRIMSMINSTNHSGIYNADFDLFKYWQQVVDDPQNVDAPNGDSHKSTYSFSIPPINYLRKIEVPTLVTFGTKDLSAIFNDYLRTDIILKGKKNFTFKAYPELEHNYFGLTEDGRLDSKKFNWDKVAQDWLNWIETY